MRIKKITQNTRNFNITDAVTDGGTDLNKDTFNGLQDNIEDAINKKGNFIKASITNDFTLTTNDMTTIKFDYIQDKLGDDLSLTEDGGIKIGKGISAIRTSGQAYFYTGSKTGIKTIYLYKNTGQMSATNYIEPLSNYVHLVSPTLPISVKEGDIIYFQVRGTANDVFKNYNTGTFLTVEVIK